MKKFTLFTRISVFTGFIIATAAVAQVIPSAPSASAGIMDGFNPEYIISDSNFTKANSMSTSDIQAFLNRKNSVCLKNFTTLGLYDENKNGIGDEPYGKNQGIKVSAATLIKQASNIYGISPKVILATLQKEQGLITRTDCPQWRYNTALGYGCPDTEPCDNSAYGFTRQIDYGVYHFKGFFNDTYPIPPTVPGEKTISYNPDSRCGGKSINIRNRATAALYSYTPYQPNKYTLDGGTSDSYPACGAFGNKNFFYYYSAWFGSPNSGTDHYFVQCDDGKYLIESNEDRRRLIPEATAVEWNMTADDFVDIDYGCNFPKFSLSLGNVVRIRSSGNVYYVHNGKAYYVSSQQIAAAWGLGSLTTLPQIEPESLKSVLTLDRTGLTPIATSDNISRNDMYFIVDGKRYTIAGTPAKSIDTLRLISGDTILKSRILPASIFQKLAASGTVDASFTIGSELYVFDYGKVRKITNGNAKALITTAIEPVALPAGTLSQFSDKRTLGNVFERDGNYYAINADQSVIKTDSSRVIENIIGNSSKPTITRILTSRLVSAALSTKISNELTNSTRLIECNEKQYIVERYIRRKRLIEAPQQSEWSLDTFHYFTGDRGCEYPTYSLGLDADTIRSRSTGKVYQVVDGEARYISNQAEANTYQLGNYSSTTYPQFDGRSINDNLRVVK